MRRFLVAGTLLLAAAAPTPPDPVIAERGTDRITASQARHLIASLDAPTRARLAADPKSLANLLRDLLLQRALLEQAQTDHWDQRPDVAALLQHTRDEALAQSYLAAHAIVPPDYPAPADVEAAYAANKSKFMQPRLYHLTQLFFPSPPSPADAQKRLAALHAQLSRGRLTFDAAARQTPGLQSADLGWIGEAQLVPAVKSAVLGLPEGAITDPLCTPTGCHLIRLVATRPAGPAPLAEVHDSLVRALRQQRQADAERAYASSFLAKQPVAINEIELAKLAQ